MNTVREQILYASVDRVIEREERSGWQITESSAGLGEDEAKQLVDLVEPRLVPLTPLSGFPSAEEISVADRRLVHRSIPYGSVLIHTAPAGQDTTGRPNTMTHIVVTRRGPTTGPLLAANAWRAPWWAAPFGPVQVRETTLPSPESIGPGSVVTFDTAASRIRQPGARDVLAALADVIAHRDRTPEPGDRAMAVLAVRSVDEAARWIDTLLRTCAPEAARRLDWSLFQRVSGRNDLEDLSASGFDIVCVPVDDLVEFPVIPNDCVLIDPAAPPRSAGTTRYGRFVQAMTADLATWVSSLEAIDQVVEQLRDQSEASLEWAGAMAQACTPGLLDKAYSGDLLGDVNDALIGSRIPVESMTPYLAAVFNERLLGIDLQTPLDWQERFASLPHDLEPTAGTINLAARYLDLAVRDADWLLDATKRPKATVLRRSLSAWSADPAHRSHLVQQIEQAYTTVERALRPTQTETSSEKDQLMGLRLLGSLHTEGLTLPTERMNAWLEPAAEMLSQTEPDIDASDVAALGQDARTVLAQQLEALLNAESTFRAENVAQPQLSSGLAHALLKDLEPSTFLALEMQEALHDMVHRGDARAALRAVRAVKTDIRLAPDAWTSIASVLQPRDLNALASAGIVDWKRLAAGMLSRDPLDAASLRWACERVHASAHLQSAGYELVSPKDELETVLLLVVIASEPLATGNLPSDQVAYLAANAAHAAGIAMQAGATTENSLHELARLADRRAAAAAVLLEATQRHPGGPQERIELSEQFFQSVPRWVENSPGELIAPSGAPFGRLSMEATALLLGIVETEDGKAPIRGQKAADGRGDGSSDPAAQNRKSRPEAGQSTPAHAARLAACLDSAPLILEARVAMLEPNEMAAMREEIITALRLDSKSISQMERLVPRLAASPGHRASSIVHRMKKNLLPWQRKEGHDG